MQHVTIASGYSEEHRIDKSKWNVIVLALCQAVFNSSSSILALTAVLIGFQLLDDSTALATLPVSAMVVGTAFATVPAALLMQRSGRRVGFTVGAIIGLLGAIVASISVWGSSFWGFSFGILLIGIYNGFANHYRFAAADTASSDFRSRAISLVLAGGVVAAFLGPELAVVTAEIISFKPFLGTYVGVVVLMLVAIGLVQLINIPKPTKDETSGPARGIFTLLRQRKFVLAVMSSMIGFSVMVLVMTATPIAMVEHCGHSLNDTKFVIQWHVVAMFAPSFVTGSFIRRFGATTIIGFGIILLVAGVIFAISGVSLFNFWFALVSIGMGWNFTFVGGSTLLTETYNPAERAKAQGFHDFAVFYLVALASISSGILLQFLGWWGVVLGTLPLLLLVSGVLVWTMIESPNQIDRPDVTHS